MTERIILAADELGLEQCMAIAGSIGKRLYAIKVHNLFDTYGPAVVPELHNAGARRVWVDAKLHDIPNTVRLRAQSIARSGADIVTVHASGGADMIRAARESGIAEVYAVTVLTSLSAENATAIYGRPPAETAAAFARLAAAGGATGIVCSPLELGMLSSLSELKGMKFVVPGIRSAGADAGDQRRVATPSAAVLAGATHLVVGRQITGADDPEAALDGIELEIEDALQARDPQVVS